MGQPLALPLPAADQCNTPTGMQVSVVELVEFNIVSVVVRLLNVVAQSRRSSDVGGDQANNRQTQPILPERRHRAKSSITARRVALPTELSQQTRFHFNTK